MISAFARTWLRPANAPILPGAARPLVATVGLATMVLLALPACSPRTTQMRILDHRQAGPDAVYVETFNECYYDSDAEGNVDLVLRREHVKADDPSQTVMQIVHVRSFWKSIPGTTVAHDQQINATVRYMILSGRAGASFQGAGSIFCDKNRGRSVLEGDLGLAYLSPRTRLNNGNMLFERAEISGSFRAQHDPRRVVRILNEMDELFRFSEPGDAQATAARESDTQASAVWP